jgi:hypothetical protein
MSAVSAHASYPLNFNATALTKNDTIPVMTPAASKPANTAVGAWAVSVNYAHVDNTYINWTVTINKAAGVNPSDKANWIGILFDPTTYNGVSPFLQPPAGGTATGGGGTSNWVTQSGSNDPSSFAWVLQNSGGELGTGNTFTGHFYTAIGYNPTAFTVSLATLNTKGDTSKGAKYAWSSGSQTAPAVLPPNAVTPEMPGSVLALASMAPIGMVVIRRRKAAKA